MSPQNWIRQKTVLSLLIFSLPTLVYSQKPQATPESPVRTWVSKDGGHQIPAQLTGIGRGKVYLWRKDVKKTARVPLSKLSDKDVKFISTLSKPWGNLIDPDDKCRFMVHGNAATLHIPEGPFNLVPTRFNAPFLVQKVEEESYFVETKIEADLKTPKSGLIRSYRAAGLIAFNSPQNNIRLERASFNGTHYVNFEKREDGLVSQGGLFQESKIDQTKPTWLRLIVGAESAYAAYRQDPTSDWTYLKRSEIWLPEAFIDNEDSSTMVGVDSVNTSSRPLSAKFSEYRIVKDGEELKKAIDDAKEHTH